MDEAELIFQRCEKDEQERKDMRQQLETQGTQRNPQLPLLTPQNVQYIPVTQGDRVRLRD